MRRRIHSWVRRYSAYGMALSARRRSGESAVRFIPPAFLAIPTLYEVAALRPRLLPTYLQSESHATRVGLFLAHAPCRGSSPQAVQSCVLRMRSAGDRCVRQSAVSPVGPREDP